MIEASVLHSDFSSASLTSQILRCQVY